LVLREEELVANKTWADTLVPLIGKMRSDLGAQDMMTVAALTGASLHGPSSLYVRLWDDEWLVSFPDGVTRGLAGQPCTPDKEVTLLYYLTHGDGTTPAQRWVAFHDLPDGMFYAQAFQGYSGNRLAHFFVNSIEGFERAAVDIGGTRVEGGDAMYAFWPLPRIGLAAQYWRGDEEFAARASILFDAAAGHYLTTDGLAVLGSQLVSKLIKSPRAKYDM
jgi:hypothetical protein